jgi:hypothetical protein
MPRSRPHAWIDSRAFCSVLVNFTKRGILRRRSLAGQNDSPGESFTLMNAQSLRNANLGASMLSFWSIGRDNGGCPGQGSASASCSGVSQSPFHSRAS